MADAAVLDAPQVDAPAATEPAVAPAEPAVTWDENPRLAPPADKPAPTPSGEAPSGESPAATPAGEGEPSKPEGSAKAEIPTDWKAKLEAGDPEFLADFENHPKVKGFIAGRAAFLAQQEREALAKAAVDAEKDQAARDDPENPLSKAHLAERQKQTEANSAAVLQLARDAAVTDAMAPVDKWIRETFPEPAIKDYQHALAEQSAKGEPWTLPAFVQKAIDIRVKAELDAGVAAGIEKALPGIRKEIQAEMMTGERSPDLGTTALAAGGTGGELTDDKYAQLKPSELRALKSTAAGRAQIDKLWASQPAGSRA